MPFKVIPAVDLKDGKCVQLRQGKADSVIVALDNPVEIAKKWVEEGAKVLHVIDLSGAFSGRLYHEDIILKIRELNVEMQVGGGIRDIETAKRLIDLGIDRVILGTLAIKKVKEVSELAKEYPERVMIAVDSKKDRVVVKGWTEDTGLKPEELVKVYEGLDVSFLYTNVDVEGLIRGVALEKVKKIVKSTKNPVYVAGGISTVEDIVSIKELGAAGVVIGSALYTGKIKLRDALAVIR